MAKWCDEGETSVGLVYLEGGVQPDFWLGLYENDPEPAEDAVVTDLVEAETPGVNGYSRIQLGNGNWTEGDPGVFTNLEKTFTAAGGNWGVIYGYFITSAPAGTAGLLIAVEHFSDGPYTVNNGWSVKVTPKVTIS